MTKKGNERARNFINDNNLSELKGNALYSHPKMVQVRMRRWEKIFHNFNRERTTLVSRNVDG
jgi:hypothetical protein